MRCLSACTCRGACKCAKICKCKHEPGKNIYLDYLGYQFKISDVPDRHGKEKKIKIRIAPKKVKKIKTRIVWSFLDYAKTRNYNLLKQRIQFLTSNYQVYSNIPDSNLKAGIYYSYILTNDVNTFQDLDLFLRKLVSSQRGSIGKLLKSALTQSQRSELGKLSFSAGFSERREVHFTSEDIGKIKRCWRNE